MPWRWQRGYISWGDSFKQASKKGPMCRIHIRTSQVRLQARHPIMIYHGNHQEAFWRISSSESPINAPLGGPSGESSERFIGDFTSKELRPQKGSASQSQQMGSSIGTPSNSPFGMSTLEPSRDPVKEPSSALSSIPNLILSAATSI